MSNEHDATHEQELAAILCGEHTTVPREIAACRICNERLVRLRSAAAALDAAATEQRAVLATARATSGAIGEQRVASLVREGLGIPAARRRGQWPWWLLAAAALLAGVLFAWPRGDALPADRTLGAGETYWPTGRNLAPEDVRFRWPAEPGVRYRLQLHEADDDLLPWDTIPCDEAKWQPDPQYIARMRELRSDWSWVVESVHQPPAGGQPVTTRSEPRFFSFSR